MSALLLILAVLTNADIVKLVKAGLSAETIEAKIAVSETSFDTSTDALVALAKEGVPDRVIRSMIQHSPSSSPLSPPSGERVRVRGRYEVAIHSEQGKCEGELRVDAKAVKGSGCRRQLDFELPWPSIREICYDYGFRGTIVFRIENGEHRVSTTTPAEAKKIVETLRKTAPKTAIRERCD